MVLTKWYDKKIKKMNMWDIGALKICCVLFGMVIGAFIPGFVKEYMIAFIVVIIVLMILLLYKIFKK